MGFYLLNLSVDISDPMPEHIPEDLSINDQESIIEIVIEKIIGYEDAIKEYDDHDSEDHNNSSVKIDIISQHNSDSNKEQSFTEKAKQRLPNCFAFLSNGHQSPDKPPPKI